MVLIPQWFIIIDSYLALNQRQQSLTISILYSEMTNAHRVSLYKTADFGHGLDHLDHHVQPCNLSVRMSSSMIEQNPSWLRVIFLFIHCCSTTVDGWSMVGSWLLNLELEIKHPNHHPWKMASGRGTTQGLHHSQRASHHQNSPKTLTIGTVLKVVNPVVAFP